jgi:hypothetical protein
MVEERLLTESIYVSWVTNLASGPRAYSDKTRIISNEPRTPDDSYNTLYIADAVRDFVWDWCDFWVVISRARLRHAESPDGRHP